MMVAMKIHREAGRRLRSSNESQPNDRGLTRRVVVTGVVVGKSGTRVPTLVSAVLAKYGNRPFGCHILSMVSTFS